MDANNRELIAALTEINKHLSKISNALTNIATNIGPDEDHLDLPTTQNITKSLSKIAEGVGFYEDSILKKPRPGELIRTLQKLTEVIEENSSK